MTQLPPSTATTNPNLLLTLEESEEEVSLALQHDYFALRHGQSLANVAQRIASCPKIARHEYGLSHPVGQEQARQAGRDVVEHYYRQQQHQQPYRGLVLLTSDLLRAKETAEAVRDAAVAAQQIPLYNNNNLIQIEPRLRERWFGDWDGTCDQNYGRVWEDDALDSSHTKCGVESVDSVMRRATQAVLEWDQTLSAAAAAVSTALPSKYMVVCVAHGDVLQILQTAFSKLDGTLHRSLDHLETAKLRPLILATTSNNNNNNRNN